MGRGGRASRYWQGGVAAASRVLPPHRRPPTPQEHRHHRCLLCTSCGAAGDHVPDGERLPWACTERPRPASQLGALVCVQVVGHRTRVQILSLPHGLGELSSLSISVLICKMGQHVTVTAPSAACPRAYATRPMGLGRSRFLFPFLCAVRQDALSRSCPMILGST